MVDEQRDGHRVVTTFSDAVAGEITAQNLSQLTNAFTSLTNSIRETDAVNFYKEDLLSLINTINQVLDNIFKFDGLSNQQDINNIPHRFGNLAEALLEKHNLYRPTLDYLVRLWNKMGQLQVDEGNSTYAARAATAMFLGRIAETREPGVAVWWLLHGYADDLLNANKEPVSSGDNYQKLHLYYGVKQSTFSAMYECAKASLDSNATDIYKRLSEHIVVQLSLNHEHAYVFGFPALETVEFPIGLVYAKCLLDRVNNKLEAQEGRSQSETPRKLIGDTLEDLARYFFLLITGWVPSDNTYHSRTDIDSDVLAFYVRSTDTVSTFHGKTFLAEYNDPQKLDNNLRWQVV